MPRHRVNNMSKVGIIGAMEMEVETLQSQMNVTSTTEKANMKFMEGTLGDTNVVVVKCGIGKINAAVCVQILVDMFEVTHVINTGVAGSLNAKLDIGDILISRDVIHHDVDVTIFGYDLGEVPQLGTREFKADEAMVALAKQTCEEVNPDLHAIIGRVVSGDQFISSKEVKERLITNFQGDCAEMEGASIAHACFLNNIPFVIIRAISDKADDSADMDYPTFERKAAHDCARLTKEFVQKL